LDRDPPPGPVDETRAGTAAAASRGQGDGGFTLFETMIALIVMSIAFVSLYEASGASIRAISGSWSHMKARVLAETMMAEQMSLQVTKPAVTRGTYEQFDWEVEVAPGSGPWSELTTENPWSLYLVRVTVRWPIGRSIVLETARIGARGRQ